MTILHSADFFPEGDYAIAIEPRIPQAAFPEHHHDFHEIVLVEQGSGIHVFNGQPQTLCAGCVCFVRDHDRHLYEQTDNLCLTNVLYRSPGAFRFLSGLQALLPCDQDGQYTSHWRINHKVMAQALSVTAKMQQDETWSLEKQAHQEQLFLQLLVLLVTTIGVDLIVMHGYAFLASRAQRWLATARARQAQNRVFGGLLMAMGASLALVKRGA